MIKNILQGYVILMIIAFLFILIPVGLIAFIVGTGKVGTVIGIFLLITALAYVIGDKYA